MFRLTVLVSKLNPEVERVWLVGVQPEDRAICSTEFFVVAPRSPYGRAFVYCPARAHGFSDRLRSLVTGTSRSYRKARADAVLGLAVVRPADPILSLVEESAQRLLTRSLQCKRESRTPAALRDALLPKLISGELR